MILPAKWTGIGRYIFAFREHYEPELCYLEKVLFLGGTFVDAGANLGIYTLVAGRIVGCSGRVISIEPSVQSSPLLRRNVSLNRLTNVRTFSVALSKEAGRAWLYRDTDPCGNSLGKDSSFQGDLEDVVTETLDKLLKQAAVEHVDVIKIDVEGAEEMVLRGANDIVTSMRPTIIFEINPNAAARLDAQPYGAWQLLDRLGYKFFIVRRGALFEAKLPVAACNVVAIPR